MRAMLALAAVLLGAAQGFRLPVPQNQWAGGSRRTGSAGERTSSTALASYYTPIGKAPGRPAATPREPRLADILQRVAAASSHLGADEEATLSGALSFVLAKKGREGAQEAAILCETLASLALDAETLVAAILEGVLSSKPLGFGRGSTPAATVDDLERRFGPRVAQLTQSSHRLANLEAEARRRLQELGSGGYASADVEQLRNLLLTEATDWRVVVLRVAVVARRLQLEAALPRRERAASAREALAVHAPLAHKLGIHGLRNELEGAAFEALYPLQHAEARRRLAAIVPEQGGVLQGMAEELARALEADAEFMSQVESVRLAGRIKAPASMWRKILRVGRTGISITDVVAFRVVFETRHLPGETEAERDARSETLCYRAAEVVRNQWQTQNFKDYVAVPKPNGYQSLHVTALADGFPFEVQIRSWDMHQTAEFGVAAHWVYKGEGQPADVALAPERLQTGTGRERYFKSMADGRDFVNWFHTELKKSKVFVWGPNGSIWDMDKKTATAADILRRDSIARFYAGLRGHAACAKVNGRRVGADTMLSNGDVVTVSYA